MQDKWFLLTSLRLTDAMVQTVKKQRIGIPRFKRELRANLELNTFKMTH